MHKLDVTENRASKQLHYDGNNRGSGCGGCGGGGN